MSEIGTCKCPNFGVFPISDVRISARYCTRCMFLTVNRTLSIKNFCYLQLPTSAQWYDGVTALFPIFGSNPGAFENPAVNASSQNSEGLRRGTNLLAAHTDIEMR